VHALVHAELRSRAFGPACAGRASARLRLGARPARAGPTHTASRGSARLTRRRIAWCCTVAVLGDSSARFRRSRPGRPFRRRSAIGFAGHAPGVHSPGSGAYAEDGAGQECGGDQVGLAPVCRKAYPNLNAWPTVRHPKTMRCWTRKQSPTDMTPRAVSRRLPA
jgi:hypothetical protein